MCVHVSVLEYVCDREGGVYVVCVCVCDVCVSECVLGHSVCVCVCVCRYVFCEKPQSCTS